MSNPEKNQLSSVQSGKHFHHEPKRALGRPKPVSKMKIDNLEIVSDGSVPSDYLDFEPIAPDESDIAEELDLLGTYIDF
jgi:hypothetical protein